MRDVGYHHCHHSKTRGEDEDFLILLSHIRLTKVGCQKFNGTQEGSGTAGK